MIGDKKMKINKTFVRVMAAVLAGLMIVTFVVGSLAFILPALNTGV